MQDRYTGDIGDFGKLGLLRQLTSTGLSIGVNWYRTPDETHNSDGLHIDYLQKEEFPAILLYGLRWVRSSVPASGSLLPWSRAASLMLPILAGFWTRQVATRSYGWLYAWTGTGGLCKSYTAVTLSLLIPITV